MKFLIIRFSSIGDIVLTTPVIRCLKQQLPNAEIHFLTKKSFRAVTEANPYIDQLFCYDHNLSQLIADLKEQHYDYVIDLHKNFRSYKIRWALKCKTLVYRKLSVQKFLLTKFHINLMPGRHITDRCMDTVAPLGVTNDGYGLDYFIPPQAQIKTGDIPVSHSSGYIAIVTGASYYTKKLTVQKLQKLCSIIQFPIILIGGEEDAAEGEAIASVDPVKIYNSCGKFNLHGSADLVKRSKLVISHDTGMQYIACAFNKKVLAIWGATSPALDVEPYYGKNFLLMQAASPYQNYLVPGLSCQPCSNYGTKKCPRGHFKCIQLQDIEKIAADAIKMVR